MRQESGLSHIKSFCVRIGLSDGACEAVLKQAGRDVGGELGNAKDCYRRFLESPENFYCETEVLDSSAELFLYYFCMFAIYAEEMYRQRGISDRVYTDTFSDIRIWEEDCFAREGVHGLREYRWIARHVRLEIFRLGRLEFAPVRFPFEDVGEKGPVKGQWVLDVHIPADGPLLPDMVQESYKLAEAFFKRNKPIFICGSWLLSPALAGLLEENSGIRSFQRQYHVFREEPEDRQAEERIFGCLKEDPGQYCVKTRLQKAAAEFLKQGGRIPVAWGYWVSP